MSDHERSIGTGEPIICRGAYTAVTKVVAHPPGHHPPIRSDLWAVEIITERGSRWWGSETAPRILGDLRMHWEGPG